MIKDIKQLRKELAKNKKKFVKLSVEYYKLEPTDKRMKIIKFDINNIQDKIKKLHAQIKAISKEKK